MRIVVPLSFMLVFGVVAAAQKPASGKQRRPERSQPNSLYAPALDYGAALEKHASEALRKWAEPYARKELREKSVDPQGTMAEVDQRYPDSSDAARDAITYLLFYLAYKEEELEERMLVARLRDIDRETTEITRQLQIIWKNEQSRSASPMQGIGQQQRVAIEEQVQKVEAKLRELADERQLKSGHLDTSHRRATVFLRLLAAVRPRMDGIKPEILRSIG